MDEAIVAVANARAEIAACKQGGKGREGREGGKHQRLDSNWVPTLQKAPPPRQRPAEGVETPVSAAEAKRSLEARSQRTFGYFPAAVVFVVSTISINGQPTLSARRIIADMLPAALCAITAANARARRRERRL